MKRPMRTFLRRSSIDTFMALSLWLFTSLLAFGSSIFTHTSSQKIRQMTFTRISSFQSSYNSRKHTPVSHGGLKYSRMNKDIYMVSFSLFWVSEFTCTLEINSSQNTSALDAVKNALKCYSLIWERNIASTAALLIKVTTTSIQKLSKD